MTPTSLSRKQIESLLSEILTPVEPSSKFVGNLRARLVTYRGNGSISPWMLLAVLATSALIVASAASVLLRLLLGWVGIIGLLSGRRRTSSRSQRASTKAPVHPSISG